MTHQPEMELNLSEILHALRRRIGLILLITCLAALGVGALGYLRSRPSDSATAVSEEEMARYEENLKMSQENAELSQRAMVKLRAEWMRVTTMYDTHPLLRIDPEACVWDSITLQFEPNSGSHKGVIYDWIQTVDDEKLFGEGVGELAKYKNDLIQFDDYDSESVIYVINYEGFDSTAAAAVIREAIESEARKAGIRIAAVTGSHSTGSLKVVTDFRYNVSNMMNLMAGSLTNANNIGVFFPAPVAPVSPDAGVDMKSIVKYALIGAILGLILSICLVIFLTIRKGRLVSRRQMEETFDLELLGDCRHEDAAGLNLLNANLDIMIGEKNRVMLLGASTDEDIAARVTDWNKNSEREFIAGLDLLDDADTVDKLQSVSGIVLAVRIGDSRVRDIARLLLRTAKLDKKVLGFVEL